MAFSERKIIAAALKGLTHPAQVLVGPGSDDAACVRVGSKTLVFTSDIMFESSHFPKKLFLESAGRKAVVANLSDLASMGAKPLYLIVALGIPKKYSGLDSLIRGIKNTSREYGTSIIGGDTKCSRELTVSICAIGEITRKGKILTRNNARPGDIVAVTGNIGSAFCGLHSLLHGKRIHPTILRSFTHPSARIGVGLLLSRSCPRVATMDITDGLLHTASEIARQSKVKIEIKSKLIPISPLARSYSKKNKIPFTKLINTGEDYELLVAMGEKDFERARKRANLREIGRVVKGEGVCLNGEKVKVEGYDAFANL